MAHQGTERTQQAAGNLVTSVFILLLLGLEPVEGGTLGAVLRVRVRVLCPRKERQAGISHSLAATLFRYYLSVIHKALRLREIQ